MIETIMSMIGIAAVAGGLTALAIMWGYGAADMAYSAVEWFRSK